MFRKILAKALQQNSIQLTDQQQHKLCDYLELICSWNKVFNLTRIIDPTEMVYLHLIDSLIINEFLQGKRLLDVGSGAGLPGIPLAILNPQQEWTLLDKNNKKIRFLTQCVADLDLSNIQVFHGSCENFHPSLCFDSIVTRAFGTLGLFLEMTQHLVCDDGIFIAMKGKYPQQELCELPKHFKVVQIRKLDIKGIDNTRHVICLSKS